MITPEDIGLAMLMVILWAFVAFLWTVVYMFYQDLDEWGKPDFADYAMVAITGVTSAALTIMLAMFTLYAMGIAEG